MVVERQPAQSPVTKFGVVLRFLYCCLLLLF
jgi:hypothetical protein